MPCLAFNKNTPAYCIRGVLYFLFMPTVRAFYFLFFNCHLPPAIDINAFLICSNASIRSFSDTFLARFFRHSFLIRCCSLLKCFSIFSSSSERIATTLPKGVSGPSPTKKSQNSDHFIPLRSLDKRIPYCV